MIWLLFAGNDPIFDLLRVKGPSNLKWKANSEFENALASKFMSGVSFLCKLPKYDFPPEIVQNNDKYDWLE